jgi:hypothetical protein
MWAARRKWAYPLPGIDDRRISSISLVNRHRMRASLECPLSDRESGLIDFRSGSGTARRGEDLTVSFVPQGADDSCHRCRALHNLNSP